VVAVEAAGKDWQHGLIPRSELRSLTELDALQVASGASAELGYDRAGPAACQTS